MTRTTPLRPLVLALCLVTTNDEGPPHLRFALEPQIVEQQRVLARQKRLTPIDGFYTVIDPAVMEAVDQLIGDEGVRVHLQVIKECE